MLNCGVCLISRGHEFPTCYCPAVEFGFRKELHSTWLLYRKVLGVCNRKPNILNRILFHADKYAKLPPVSSDGVVQ